MYVLHTPNWTHLHTLPGLTPEWKERSNPWASPVWPQIKKQIHISVEEKTYLKGYRDEWVTKKDINVSVFYNKHMVGDILEKSKKIMFQFDYELDTGDTEKAPNY